MASQGPNGAGTGADVSGIGTKTWTNPGNITAADGATANVNLTSQQSHWLEATNFGFSLPANTTSVDGILVEWRKTFANVGGTILDNAIRIIKGGTVGSTDKSSGATWPTTLTYIGYGGSADLWGTTWAYTDMNASNFGAALSAKENSNNADTAQVDYCRITVYYTVPGTSFLFSQTRKKTPRRSRTRPTRLLFHSLVPGLPARPLGLTVQEALAAVALVREELSATGSIMEGQGASALAIEERSGPAALLEALAATACITEKL
jgi:hypothetical protein